MQVKDEEQRKATVMYMIGSMNTKSFDFSQILSPVKVASPKSNFMGWWSVLSNKSACLASVRS
jgi:hypothetical protein